MRCLAAFVSPLCALALLSVSGHAAAQNAALQQTVDRFYPADRLQPGDPSERHSCHLVLSTTADKEPAVIVAAYTDRANGAVRVLQRNASGAMELVYDNPDAWALRGTRCSVRQHDLDFDGQPEVLVNFLGVRAAAGWMFRWDGSSLANITPTESDGIRETSVLLSPAVYDLEHTGSLRVIAAGGIDRMAPGERPRFPAFVYRLGPMGLEVDKAILAVMGFRADVDPRGNVRSFRPLQDSFPPYTLRVINGDRSGRHRVKSASIRVNGVEAIGPADLNERTQFATTVLTTLFTQNQLTATLEGEPEAQIIVLVEDSTRR